MVKRDHTLWPLAKVAEATAKDHLSKDCPASRAELHRGHCAQDGLAVDAERPE